MVVLLWIFKPCRHYIRKTFFLIGKKQFKNLECLYYVKSMSWAGIAEGVMRRHKYSVHIQWTAKLGTKPRRSMLQGPSLHLLSSSSLQNIRLSHCFFKSRAQHCNQCSRHSTEKGDTGGELCMQSTPYPLFFKAASSLVKGTMKMFAQHP